MHNSIQIIGNLGRDPEQRVASKWHPVHGLVRGHATCLEERSRRVAVEDRLAPCRLLQSHERRSSAPSHWRSSACYGLASEQPLQAGNRQKQEIHEHQTHVVADPSEHNSQAESYCEGAGSSHFRLRERVARHTILGSRFALGRGAAGAFSLSSLAAVNVANSPQDRCDPRFGLAIASRHGNKRRWFRLAVWYDAGRGKHWTRGKRVYRARKFLVRSKRMKSNSNAFGKIFSPAAVHGSHRFGSLPSR